MKKICYLLFILLLGIVMVPKVFAADKVAIESIEMVEKSDYTQVNSEPTFSGLDMNYDISFGEVGDFIKYKIVVKNNTNTDYKISEKEFFSDSEYIKYTYEVGEILKAHDSVEVSLTIKYNSEIAPFDFVEGKYTEKNKASLKLLNEEGEPVNPNTSSSATILTYLGISVVLISFSVLMFTKNKKSAYTTMLLGLVLLPFVVKAIEELELNASVKIEIKTYYSVTYAGIRSVLYTEDEYVDSDFEEDFCQEFYFNSVEPGNKRIYCSEYQSVVDPKKYEYGETVTVGDVEFIDFDIKDCTWDGNNRICPESAIFTSTRTKFIYVWPASVLDEDNHVITKLAKKEFKKMNLKDADGNELSYYDDLELWTGDTFNMVDHDVFLSVPSK